MDDSNGHGRYFFLSGGIFYRVFAVVPFFVVFIRNRHCNGSELYPA